MAFDNPFYTFIPAPPLGPLDPCYAKWVRANQVALQRAEAARLYGDKAQQYLQVREAYYEAARQYAFCLDDVWGQNEF